MLQVYLIWIVYIASLALLPGVQSINCYTCSSSNGSNPACEDPINTSLSKYTEKCLVPKKGHVGEFPANFCIKIVGRNTDTYESMVIRACAMKTMDSQCGMFRYEDATMIGCVLTCDYNGCNNASRYQLFKCLLIFPILTWLGVTSYILSSER